MMPRPVRIYLTTAAAMLAIDAVWLTIMADALYRPQIGHLMREQFLLTPALAFYALYIAGILILAQLPAADRREATWRGFVFGLCAYGTYDLTNQATLKDWPVVVTLMDLAWGSALTAVVSCVGFVPAKSDRSSPPNSR